MNKKYLEPSLLAFDINNLNDSLDELKKIGIEYIHYDVMDIDYIGHSSFDNSYIQIILDKGFKVNVHLMVKNPIKWIKQFESFDINAITFHTDGCINDNEAFEVINYIKNLNIKVGIAIKPEEKFSSYKKFLLNLDIVTIMSVVPGAGGQSFMEIALNNISDMYHYKISNKNKPLIQIDGGVNMNNIPLFIDAVDFVISGSGFMSLNTEMKQKMMEIISNS